MIIDFLLSQRVADGGFNCRNNRPRVHVTHSSMHTTVSVLEGITRYLRSGHDCRREALEQAATSSAEFLMRHRLFRSERTGEVINPEFTRLHFPARWHFDILRGLTHVADARAGKPSRWVTVIAERVHLAYPD